MGFIGAIIAFLLIVFVIYLIFSHINQILFIVLATLVAIFTLVIILSICEVMVKKRYTEDGGEETEAQEDSPSFAEKFVDKIKSKPQCAHMSEYEIEQYAKECNAYVVREEREEQNQALIEEKLISEVNSKIDKINELAVIINKTTNREEFYNCVKEIEDILTELSEKENELDFPFPPSAHLKDFRKGKSKRIELLEKRIVEKEKENVQSSAEKKSSSTAYDRYYENIAKQKENNLQITYQDMECYDLRPFELNKPFISDGHFTAIELDRENLEKAYQYLQAVHEILAPYNNLFENAIFPNKIGIGYDFGDKKDHLPTSHLRLQPYTATKKSNKYPFYLWLSLFGYYGTEYIYMIYFNQDGEIGKADLNLHGSNGARLSYESKIRRNENGLYVMRINKTLYVEPYGTKILYHYQDDIQKADTKENNQSIIETPKEPKPIKRKPQRKYMSQYDIEQFAKECNTYIVHEERKERQKREQESSKIQSGIESFNNDIFETNQELDNIGNDTLSKNEEWEKLNAELSDVLRDYGNLYVNLFSERFYVNSSLINSRTIENNSTEFIIKCETLEQAKYVVTHENELNQNLKSTHKMTLLANNCISLIVIRK